MKSFINVRFEIFGKHNWPKPIFDDVEFLKYPHTHTFKFRCKFAVTHTNRDREFYMVKKEIINFLDVYFKTELRIMDFRDSSCEKLASILMNQFSDMLECEVSEDDLDSGLVIRD